MVHFPPEPPLGEEAPHQPCSSLICSAPNSADYFPTFPQWAPLPPTFHDPEMCGFPSLECKLLESSSNLSFACICIPSPHPSAWYILNLEMLHLVWVNDQYHLGVPKVPDCLCLFLLLHLYTVLPTPQHSLASLPYVLLQLQPPKLNLALVFTWAIAIAAHVVFPSVPFSTYPSYWYQSNLPEAPQRNRDIGTHLGWTLRFNKQDIGAHRDEEKAHARLHKVTEIWIQILSFEI